MLSKIALLLISVTLASAQVTKNESCPTAVTPLSATPVLFRLLGTKYHEQRRFPFIYEEDSRCNYAIFSIDLQSLLGLSGKATFSQIYTNGTAWTLEGKVAFPNILQAIGDITIPGFPGVARVSAIATDDDLNYGVIFGCTDIGNGSSIQYAWIVTKEVNPPESVVNSALTDMQRQNIDITPFIKTNQTNCG